MAIIDFLKTATKVYDPSLHEISIGDLILDGVTSINSTSPSIAKTISGTHSIYSCVVQEHTKPTTVSFNVLPTAFCIDNLFNLINYLEQNGGFFDVIVKRSGRIVIQGTGWFEQKPNENLSSDASDLTFTVMVNQHNTPTQTINSLGPTSLENFLEI